MTTPTPAAAPTLEWLGQAGFALRADEYCVVFDPYLSDLCQRVHGLVRQVAAPASPTSLKAQWVLISHWHEDHLDLDSAAEFAATGARFVAPPSCVARLAGMGIDPAALVTLQAGATMSDDTVSISAVAARHAVPGFLTEDAVGYVVEIGGARIYHSGDTEYDRVLLAATEQGRLDVALLCTNGTAGNMNVVEAAALAAQLAPARAVPMHFGMWLETGYGPGATLDPRQFVELYRRLCPDAAATIPELHTRISVRA